METGASAPVVVPEGVDEPPYVDLMPIPDIVDYRGLSGREFKVGLPDALNTSFGVEQIVIRRLGEERWVFLDHPTATIWPQVVRFFEEHELPVETRDAGSGTLETEWLIGNGADVDEIFDSLEGVKTFARDFSAFQYKFRVRVEPGVRSGSTELHVDQKEFPVGAPFRVDALDWSTDSDNPELEGKVLEALAYYLGDRVQQDVSVSLMAAGLQDSKATLMPESTGLVLQYKLEFNRAWATVGAALENAKIPVDDLDRTSGNYYVHYTGKRNQKSGLLKRLVTFGRSKSGGAGGYKFRIHLEASDGGIHVTAIGEGNDFPEGDPEELLLSERLLKLIREHST